MAQCEKPSLETILSMLGRAKSDNDKFASLLVLSKITSANDLTEDERKKVFETIGFSFPIRLLISSCSDECKTDSKSVVYAALGSSVLSAFCTSADVVKGKDILNAVPHALKVVEEFSKRFGENELATQAVNDCLDFLIAVSHHKEHLEKLISLNILSVISSLDIVAIPKCSELLLFILSLHAELWLQSDVWDLLTKLSCNFKQNQEKEKFQLCQIINGLVSSIPRVHFHQFRDFDLITWREDVLEGCKQILCSRVTVPQRQSALILVSTTLSLFDIDSCFRSSEYMFFIVVVRLSCIEIGLILQQYLENEPRDSLAGLHQSLPVVVACYGIVEAYCVAVSNFERDDNSILTFEHIRNVQSTLDDVAKCCSAFLEEGLQKTDVLSQQHLYFMHSTIRFLGSYLNVEYHVANNAEMLHVLVKVIHYITPAFKDNVHLFNYIAPAILISLENEGTRTSFLHEDVISSLLQFLQFFYGEENSNSETLHLVIQSIIAICTFCGNTLEKVLCKMLSFILNQKLESVHEESVPYTHTLLVVLLNKLKNCDFLESNRSTIQRALEKTLQCIKKVLEDQGSGQE